MDYYYTNKGKNLATKERASLKLKVCGMNKNTSEVAALKPDYLGFIFWEPSKRFFKGDMPSIPHSIKKVGVFVDASIQEIKHLTKQFKLLYVQLHGKESPAFCDELKKQVPQIKIIKVFSIKNNFDFKQLRHFEDVCDYYLFDTKGKLPGGNGYTFNWSVLKNYPSTKPYFLSGGIGIDEIASINEFIKRPESQYCHAIDINSKFELEPGLKDIEKLKEFKKSLTNNE
ncbi:phosphoribosylanthranilate isomerase [Croceitalea sp. MTPC9]|uniref:phosphoribosylanthranilate isomerase n=1 Tax=unclassified Croceitalea TaxID=2632280 RepID=UPI002B3BAB28|nr:phosphoribosylanthranilate isomerase [Croceitalea sp. MTPC6]GMN18301.1 phosphoribosylanthranilate isomerase [Croceitalea sp. MTPC9]